MTLCKGDDCKNGATKPKTARYTPDDIKVKYCKECAMKIDPDMKTLCYKKKCDEGCGKTASFPAIGHEGKLYCKPCAKKLEPNKVFPNANKGKTKKCTEPGCEEIKPRFGTPNIKNHGTYCDTHGPQHNTVVVNGRLCHVPHCRKRALHKDTKNEKILYCVDHCKGKEDVKKIYLYKPM